jgi:hypothetical protein
MHGLGYLICIAFFIFPLIEFVLGTSVRFPQPLYIPIDFASHFWAIYAVFYTFICFAIHNSGMMVITTCLNLNSMTDYLANEFKILGISFETVFEGEENVNMIERFKTLVKQHQEILRYNLILF